jgi:heme A synthase
MGIFRKFRKPKQRIMNSIVLAFLRHILTFIGGTFVAKGILDEASMTELIGAVISGLSVLWMTVDKAKKKE